VRKREREREREREIWVLYYSKHIICEKNYTVKRKGFEAFVASTGP